MSRFAYFIFCIAAIILAITAFWLIGITHNALQGSANEKTACWLTTIGAIIMGLLLANHGIPPRKNSK